MNSLPSWNDGAAKDAIIGFVSRVTDKNGLTNVSMANDWREVFAP